MGKIGVVLVLLAACTGCGDDASKGEGPPSVYEGDANPARDVPAYDHRALEQETVRVDVDDPTVEPVRASSLYELPTTAALADSLRVDARRTRPPAPQADARWGRKIQEALERAGIKAPAHVRAAKVDGGTLEIVEALGAQPNVPWVLVERWRGKRSQVLKDRAAFFVTPLDYAGMRVEQVDLAGMTAYRSNIDDPQRPTIAWLHGGLFVKVGASQVERAAAVHVALGQAGAYDRSVDDASATPPGQTSTPHARLIGEWIATHEDETYHLDVSADGTWRAQDADDASKNSRGTWVPTEHGYRLHARFVEGKAVEDEESTEVTLEGPRLLLGPPEVDPTIFTRRGDASTASEATSSVAGTWLLKNGDIEALMHVAVDGTWRVLLRTDPDDEISSGTWRRDGVEYAFVTRVRNGLDVEPQVTASYLRDGKLIATDAKGREVPLVRHDPTQPRDEVDDLFEEIDSTLPDLVVGTWYFRNGDIEGLLRVASDGAWRLVARWDPDEEISSGTWRTDGSGYAFVTEKKRGKEIEHTVTTTRLRGGALVTQGVGGDPDVSLVRRDSVDPRVLSVSPFEGPDKGIGPAYAYLGVVMHKIDPVSAEIFNTHVDAGVLLSYVVPGSPAHRAGLQSMQVMASLNGKPVGTPQDARIIIRSMRPGQHLRIHVSDGRTVTATLGSTHARSEESLGEQTVRFGSEKMLLGPEMEKLHQRGYRVSSIAGDNGRWMAMLTQSGAEKLQAIFVVASLKELSDRVLSLFKHGWMVASVESDGRKWVLVAEKGDVRYPQEIRWTKTAKGLASEIERLRKLDFELDDLAYGDARWVGVFTKRPFMPGQDVVVSASTKESDAEIKARWKTGGGIAAATRHGATWLVVMEKRSNVTQAWARAKEKEHLEKYLPKRWKQHYRATVLGAHKKHWFVVFEKDRSRKR